MASADTTFINIEVFQTTRKLSMIDNFQVNNNDVIIHQCRNIPNNMASDNAGQGNRSSTTTAVERYQQRIFNFHDVTFMTSYTLTSLSY